MASAAMVDESLPAAAARRVRDRIDSAPRFEQGDAIRLNRMFRGRDTQEMLASLVADNLIGEMAVVSSFGAESAALLHLVAQVDRGIPVIFIDTGRHFPETLAYRDELVERLGLTTLVTVKPDPEALAARDANALRWSWDPDGCCEMRKVRPLARALAPFDAAITGRKAFQSATRAQLPRFELDASDAQGRLKVNPLIDWPQSLIDAYFEEHALPRHPLVARGYPSIGCSPCTSRVQPGEDPRAGRWRGWEKVECGIHSPNNPIGKGEDDLPPGYEPVF